MEDAFEKNLKKIFEMSVEIGRSRVNKSPCTRNLCWISESLSPGRVSTLHHRERDSQSQRSPKPLTISYRPCVSTVVISSMSVCVCVSCRSSVDSKRELGLSGGNVTRFSRIGRRRPARFLRLRRGSPRVVVPCVAMRGSRGPRTRGTRASEAAGASMVVEDSTKTKEVDGPGTREV